MASQVAREGREALEREVPGNSANLYNRRRYAGGGDLSGRPANRSAPAPSLWSKLSGALRPQQRLYSPVREDRGPLTLARIAVATRTAKQNGGTLRSLSPKVVVTREMQRRGPNRLAQARSE